MPTQDIYDRDYFEDGICAGKSFYINYRWMPEATIRMAYNMIKHLNLHDHDLLLDYGCAKGYLVKALRILDISAYGCDISRYAINCVDADVREYCKLVEPGSVIPFDIDFDWLITKDVMEHLSERAIDRVLHEASQHVRKMFHVIPLGNNGQFRVPEYHSDVTHIQIQNENWWIKKFQEHGWKIIEFSFKVRGVKENWWKKYDKGNGFFTLAKDIQR